MNKKARHYHAKKRVTATPAVYLILLRKDGCILLMLRTNTGYMDEKWDLPSGHLENDETLKNAMIREAGEEIGVTIALRDLKFVVTSFRARHDDTGPRADWIFKADKWTGNPRICEDKCKKIAWFKPDQLPRNTIPHIRAFINAWKSGVVFRDLDVHWLKEVGYLTK